jgi:CRP/FNR family transcriptional regulator, anaerobic regulatory protein
MTEKLISFLRQHGSIPDDDAKLIASCFTTRTYEEGAVLFKENSICKELFFIYDGVLRIATIGETGNDVTFFFLYENALCCILESFLNQTIAGESIIAACPVTTGVISRTELDQLYVQLPYLQPLITQVSQQQLIHKIALRNSYFSLQDAASRYKVFLEKQPSVALRVPLNSIASYLGITPQSLSRIRRNIR